jgi:hypothetical protein
MFHVVWLFSSFFQGKAGRVTSHAVSCRPVTVADSARSQVSPCDACVRQYETETSSISSMPHIYSIAHPWRYSVSVTDSVVQWHINTLYGIAHIIHFCYIIPSSVLGVLWIIIIVLYHLEQGAKQSIIPVTTYFSSPYCKSEWQVT